MSRDCSYMVIITLFDNSSSTKTGRKRKQADINTEIRRKGRWVVYREGGRMIEWKGEREREWETQVSGSRSVGGTLINHFS